MSCTAARRHSVQLHVCGRGQAQGAVEANNLCARDAAGACRARGEPPFLGWRCAWGPGMLVAPHPAAIAVPFLAFGAHTPFRICRAPSSAQPRVCVARGALAARGRHHCSGRSCSNEERGRGPRRRCAVAAGSAIPFVLFSGSVVVLFVSRLLWQCRSSDTHSAR